MIGRVFEDNFRKLKAFLSVFSRAILNQGFILAFKDPKDTRNPVT